MGSRPARHRYCRCGTHLAADNKERQCTRCQRASRDKLIAPPQVPPEFWQAEQLREAFTAQHIGRVARAYRMHPHHHGEPCSDGRRDGRSAGWVSGGVCWSGWVRVAR